MKELVNFLMILFLFIGSVCGQRAVEERFFTLTDTAFEKGAMWRTHDLEFEHDVLAQVSENQVDSLAKLLNSFPELMVRIEVHLEHGQVKGYEAQRVKIDQARAESLKQYLINRGIASPRIVAEGMGMYRPLVRKRDLEALPEDKRTLESRKNRRVEFHIVGILPKK